MRNKLLGAALLVAVPAALNAQTLSDPRPTFQLSPYAGYMVFGDYFETPNNIEYSNKDGALVGAQASYHFNRSVGIYGNFGYAKSQWTFENYFGNGSDLSLDDVGIWVYDAGMQFRFAQQPGSWISPFVQLGAGAVKYTADTDDFGSRGENNFAFNGGIGADFQLGRSVGLRLMAKDYITSLEWNDIENVSVRDKTAHNWGLSVGLNFGR